MPQIKHAYVCMVCHRALGPQDGRFKKRIEYVSANGKQRLRVVTLGTLCGRHAQEDAELESKGIGYVASHQYKQLDMHALLEGDG